MPLIECGGTSANNDSITAWHNANLAILQNAAGCVTDDCPWTVTSDFNLGNFNAGPCGGGSNTGSITIEYTVDDGCFQSMISATLTIEDQTPPVVNDPDLDDMSFDCVLSIPVPEASITLVEPCGTASFTYLGDSPSGDPCSGFQIIRSYELIDACNNRDTFLQTFTLNDDQDPTISCAAGPTNIEACGVATSEFNTAMNGLEYNENIRLITLAELISVGGTAADNCGIDSLYYYDSQNGACPITVTRTYVVVDSCDNRAQCVEMIVVDDTTPPLLTVPNDVDVEGCTIGDIPGVSGLPYSSDTTIITLLQLQGLTPGTPDASDACGIFEIKYIDALVNDSCQYGIVRTFVVEDTCGNRTFDTQNITIRDLTPPTITCPDNINTDGCTTAEVVTVSGLPFSTAIVSIPLDTFLALPSTVATPALGDNCGISTVTYQDVLNAANCPQLVNITRTFIVTDSCDLTAFCFQTIILVDNTDPTLVGPNDITTEDCGTADLLAITGLAYNPGSATTLTKAQYDNHDGTGVPLVNDNCLNVTVDYIDVVTSTNCPTVIERTFTAFDACNNSSVPFTQTITITDNTRPVITCPGTITEVCYEGADAPYANFAAFVAAGGSATDCRIDLGSFMHVGDSTYVGSSCPIIYRTYSIADSCGNLDSCVQQLRFTDNSPPSISGIPPDVAINCDSCIQDFENGDFETPTRPGPGSFDCAGNNRGGCTCNWATCSGCTPCEGASSPPGMTGWGGFGRWAYFHEDWVPGWQTNINDPRIELHPTGFDNLVSRSGIQHAELNAHQNADFYQRFCTVPTTTLRITFSHAKRSKANNTTPDIMQVLIGPTLGSLSLQGTYTNSVNSTWNDHVINYNVPPGQTETFFVFQAVQGSPVSILEGNCVDAISVVTLFDPAYTPSSSDNCGASPPVLTLDTTLGNCNFNYQLHRIWTATDLCGNETTRTQTLTVGDLDAPFFCTPLNDTILPCGAPEPTLIVPTICDSCDLNPTAVRLPDMIEPGSCSQDYTLVRRWYMDDVCNNEDTVEQRITWQDIHDPVITCPPNITVNCDDTLNAGPPATATNVCGITFIYYTDNFIAGPCDGNYTIERTWIADDTCAQDQCLQIITVQDTTRPVVTCVVSDLTLQCDQDYNADITAWLSSTESDLLANSTDNCGVFSVTNDWDSSLPTLDCSGSTGLTITFTVTDDCGNPTVCTGDIYIVDTIAPSVTCVANDLILDCDRDYITEIFDWIDTTQQNLVSNTTDQCGDTIIVSNDWDTIPPTFTCAGSSSITVTFSIEDRCGNVVTCAADVIVQDTTPPTINCAAFSGQTVSCWDSLLLVMRADSLRLTDTIANIATDACWDDFTVTIAPLPPLNNCPHVATVTYTITDPCGNSTDCSVDYTVDNGDPIISCPADATFTCYVDLVAEVMADSLELVQNGLLVDAACGMAFTVEVGPIPSLSNCPNDVAILFTVRDSCDRTDTCSVTYSFVQEAPTITCPAPETIEGCDVTILASSGQVGSLEYSTTRRVITIGDLTGLGGTAADNCGIDSLYYFDSQTGSCPVVVTRTFVVVDSCDLADSCTQVITIEDTTIPTITCADDVTGDGCDLTDVDAITGSFGFGFSTDSVYITENEFDNIDINSDANDNCGVFQVSYWDLITNASCPIIIERTWTVFDSCLNTINCVQTITVQDTMAPQITCPTDILADGCTLADVDAITGGFGHGFSTDSVTITEVEFENIDGTSDASDNCGVLEVTYWDNVLNASCPIIIERTWTVFDTCLNTRNCIQTITVQDTMAPSIICPADTILRCLYCW